MSKRIAAVAIIICLAVLVTGCRNPVTMFLDWLNGGGDSQEEANTDIQPGEDLEADGPAGARLRDTVLYYRDSDGYLVPMSVDIE